MKDEAGGLQIAGQEAMAPERIHSTLSICIPTAKRPEIVARLLHNLAQQTRLPDEILVIDASPDAETAKVIADCQALFPVGALQRVPSPLGLTLQRNVGIDHATGGLIGMLDDDVVLEPDCLQLMEAFMNSPAGERFGGISAYLVNGYGAAFCRYERLYHRLGVYESLKPGTWLYCGDHVDISRLQPFEGIFETQYIPGGTVLWRRAVFDLIRPDSTFRFGGEDKHLSLRVSQRWAVGVLGQAHMRHDHVAGGVRRHPVAQAIRSMRNRAIILRECDARPSWRRYATHLAYQWLDLSRLTLTYLALGRWRNLQRMAGSWVGWAWNLVLPPRRPASRAVSAARPHGQPGAPELQQTAQR